MSEPDWIDVATPTVQLRALTWGPPDGPIALCLHGFPDTAYGWRKVAPLLVDAGWRVVAPFMRGYAPSSIPADGSYHVGALIDDAMRVLEAAGPTGRDVVIGHDWGAIAAAGLAAMPDSPFAKAVIMSVPPLAAFRPWGRAPDQVRLAAQLPRQLLRSWYIMYFQLPWLPERSAFRVVPPLWRQWSPGYDEARGRPAGRGRDRCTGELACRTSTMYRANFRVSKPPAEYADCIRWFLKPPVLPTCTCTATTTVAWHRITSPGSSGFSRRAVTRSSSRAPGTSCNSSSRKWWHATSSTSSGKPDWESMTVRRLAAVDAQTYWMSAKIPNDQFLLYGFAGLPANLDQAIDVIRGRANACAELRLRVRDGGVLTYPAWVSGDVDADQFAVHELDDNSWAGCLAAVSRLADDQLDPRVWPWRLHVFTPVDGIPTTSGAGTVAVLQIAHALGDGVRASALAALLFGRDRRCSVGDATAGARNQRCRGAASRPRGRIASWSATPKRGWCLHRRSRGLHCGPTPVRPAYAACAPWSGTAINCPVRR